MRIPHPLARLAAVTLAAVTLAAVTLTACGGPSTTDGWTVVRESKLSAAEAVQLEAAHGARDALFSGLLAELTRARTEHGTAAAIPVCSEVAPRIARDVGAERGLRIGRTSTRLRNPANTAPDWAAALLGDRGGPDEPVTVTHDDGRLGAVMPIFLMKPCLACHGGSDEIAPDVEQALAKLYPDDRATGYRENDLRGWFWVEVPPAKD